MTFMADLTPDRYSATNENDKFHTAFADSFGSVSHIAKDYDDQDEWGSNWRGVASVRELEG
jgi:hypothetical protein